MVAGLEQAQVAAALHVSHSTVGTWERDRSTPPWLALEAMAKLFNVPVELLSGGPITFTATDTGADTNTATRRYHDKCA